MNDVDKALTYFQGISKRDPALATEHMHPTRYVEHNPHVRDDVEGVRAYVAAIAPNGPYLKVIRAYQDASFVVTQADGHVEEHCTFFDVWRFDDGRIVEHWSFSAKAGPPNKSGHTQVDGPTEARRDVDTERSKALARDYYQAVHVEGRHELIPRYISDDMPRHEPGVADGREAFERDLAVLTKDRTIDGIAMLLGQGDFVFILAKGTHAGDPCVYVDLYRVEGDRLVEHWGFPQPIPPAGERRNGNGMV